MLTGIAVQQYIGPQGLIILLVACAMCVVADSLAPPARSRLHLAARYLAASSASFGVSFVAAAVVDIYLPSWAGHVFEAQIVVCAVAALLLHPIVAVVPIALREGMDAALARIRGGEQKGNG